MPEPPPPHLDAAQRAEQSHWMARIAARGEDGVRAMAQLFAAYERRTVRRLQWRFRLDEREAEDVWQEAAMDAWENAWRFRPGDDLAPWLMVLAKNRALKLLDRAWRRHRNDLGEHDGASVEGDDAGTAASEDDSPPVSVAAPSGTAATGFAGNESRRNMDADRCTDLGLEKFELQHPIEARWLFARDLEGRDVPSLAAEMGCSETAARQRLRLMRQKLKPFLEHCRQLLNND
jgi:RNA polymerase sigma factor (sigma-70 family)